MTTKETIPMPEWRQPQGTKTGIFFENSLTRKLDELIIPAEQGRTLYWYTCGPTVYDMSHLGHARSYIGFDIVRRIMEDYFHYNLIYIVNVTDIDDKIIKKANRVLLVKLVKQVQEALKTAKASEETVQFVKQTDDRLEADFKEKEKEKQLKTAEIVDLIEQVKKVAAQEKLLTEEQLKEEPGFFDVPRHFEAEFWKDMKSLYVKYPTVVTRVTEHVPQIIKYIEDIVKNGFAYESNGSVYFDTAKFREKGHEYGKLEPWSVGNSTLLGEGEGEWSSGQKKATEKKSPNDFALWKRSVPGDPVYDSPWSRGRPGWHIECSAMAGFVTGKSTLDVHCGGVDLKFPHHDNEIAQAEAHYDCAQWVNYFMHTGHLSINGMSMSKSKKNFITIREALESYSGRHIRMLFLNYRFKDPMEYSLQTMNAAVERYNKFNEFFLNIKAVIRTQGSVMVDELWSEKEFKLNQTLMAKRDAVHKALQTNFDTKTALDQLNELVDATNVYLKETEVAKKNPKLPILRQVADYVTYMFRVFGLLEPVDSMGFPVGEEGQNFEEQVRPYLDVLSSFRDQIRSAARQKKTHGELLGLCDEVRDETLPKIGVRLEDKPSGVAVWKLEDPEVLMQEAERKKEEKIRKEEEIRKKKEEEAEKKRKEEEQAKIPPQDMFKSDPKYTEFDAEGIPTQMVNEKGEKVAIGKSVRSKLQTAYKKQQKLHQAYLAKSTATTISPQ